MVLYRDMEGQIFTPVSVHRDMEGEIFTPVPVSILKKTRVNEALNRNVKRERGVVVVEEQKKRSDGSDPDSEDSALCLEEDDSCNEKISSIFNPPLDHAPTPGNNA